MNRRTFLRAVGALSAAIALPVEPLVAILPKQWGISPVRWIREFDIYQDCWIFRADCFVGKSIEETPTRITLDNHVHLGVNLKSATEDLSAKDKEVALEVLMNAARYELKKVSA